MKNENFIYINYSTYKKLLKTILNDIYVTDQSSSIFIKTISEELFELK